jgi:hypothetical protein
MNKNNNQDGLFMTFEQKELFCKFCRIWELNSEFKDKKYDKFLEAYWKDKDKITPEELLELYIADFETGRLFCRETGKERGFKKPKSSYKVVQISIRNKKKPYPFHTILWTMYHGRWPAPDKIIDHIDRNPANNSVSNLFEATHEQNVNNRTIKNYKFGILSKTFKNGSKKYVLRRSSKYLGTFKTHEEAMACSLAYSKQLEDQGITPAS